MKPDLSKDEVDALLGEEAPAQGVIAPRDFRRPRRLGATELASLTKKVSSCLPAIEQTMARRFGGDLALSLVHIDETTREAFLGSLEDQGFFVQSCAVEAHAGWTQWDPQDARRAVERSLGCGSSDQTDVPLSSLERSLAGGFAADIAAGIALEFGVIATKGEAYTEKRLLRASVDAAPDGDEQRLSVTIELSTDSITSQLHLYLPGISVADECVAPQVAPADLPSHLDDVEVVLSAELASLELPLQEFLNLEEGDVIALGPKHEMQTSLVVDGRPAGSATFGREGDQLALRVEDFRVEPNN